MQQLKQENVIVLCFKMYFPFCCRQPSMGSYHKRMGSYRGNTSHCNISTANQCRKKLPGGCVNRLWGPEALHLQAIFASPNITPVPIMHAKLTSKAIFKECGKCETKTSLGEQEVELLTGWLKWLCNAVHVPFALAVTCLLPHTLPYNSGYKLFSSRVDQDSFSVCICIVGFPYEIHFWCKMSKYVLLSRNMSI